MDSFEQLDSKVKSLDVSISDLIVYFKTKCKECGHHRIMHDEYGACTGVMNKPCTSGCDFFIAE